jgi:hypothetical protein
MQLVFEAGAANSVDLAQCLAVFAPIVGIECDKYSCNTRGSVNESSLKQYLGLRVRLDRSVICLRS